MWIEFRRFTHQHLAQLKFLLPEEIGIRKVLMADEETRCMKYDLHVTLNVNRITMADRRKRGSICCSLRDRFISQLLEFVRNHPVVSTAYFCFLVGHTFQ